MVKAEDKTKVQGAANPALTIAYSGFVNGETKAVITEPLAATSAVTDSAVGTYTITLTGGSAANYTLTLEPGVLSVTAAEAPVFTIQPQSQTVSAPGIAVTFTVAAVGAPAPDYQWYRNGVAIAGATSSFIILNSLAQSADAGKYSAVASNSAGSARSGIAVLDITQAGNSASHAVSGSGYVAGKTVTIANTLTYTGVASALSWVVLLPPEWSFVSAAGSVGDITSVQVGSQNLLEWSWSKGPVSPVNFTYTVNVPAAQNAPVEVIAMVGVTNGSNLQFVAKPDPLTLAPITTHSADSDKNFRLSLPELTRVIELYNTRNGTTRTGCYAVATTATEDGFAADSSRLSSKPAALSRYHTADSNRDGKISLTELTRVIELYNYRSGTTRTGQYKSQSGTEDGFAPGP
jgi:hypothetical protein